jgi:small subunit ribosomal protein S6
VEKQQSYELVVLFNIKENHYATGLEAVKKLLTGIGSQITREEDMGDRALAYLINKEDRGHYHLIIFTGGEAHFVKLNEQLKLVNGLLRSQIIKAESPRKYRPKKVRKAKSDFEENRTEGVEEQ